MRYTLELKNNQDDRAIIGTTCFICGEFIPINWISGGDTQRICEECRKRLKEMLYPNADMREGD